MDLKLSELDIKEGEEVLKCIQTLNKLGLDVTGDITSELCFIGKLQTIKYLHENCIPFTNYALMRAIEKNRIDVIKFLYNIGVKYPTENEESNNANLCVAEDCNSEVFKFLEDQGIEFSDDFIIDAIKCGNTDLVKYLFPKNIKGTSLFMNYAIDYGHLDIVKYFVEQGLGKDCMEAYVKHAVKYPEIAEFLKNNIPR
jgi:ankyrin repeat protein